MNIPKFRTARTAYKYALKNGKINAHGEKLIKNDGFYAYYYAENIIKGRWIEAEAAISKTICPSYKYAKNILKRRFIEAESTLCKDGYYAYNYAVDIIKDRWVEAEDVIKEEKCHARPYVREVLIPNDSEELHKEMSLKSFDYSDQIAKAYFELKNRLKTRIINE